MCMALLPNAVYFVLFYFCVFFSFFFTSREIGKVCDAVEVAGRNVMSTSSTVTTGLVSHR